jgi:hypothetical protein
MESPDEDREPGDSLSADGLAEVAAAAEQGAIGHEESPTKAFVQDALSAVAEMALLSKRRQADLDAALRHARLEARGQRRLAVLERLRRLGFIDKVVELTDGGVLLSVTALGLQHLDRSRRN